MGKKETAISFLTEQPSYRSVFRLMEMNGTGAVFEFITAEGTNVISYQEFLGLIDEAALRLNAYFDNPERQNRLRLATQELDRDDPGKAGWIGLKLRNTPAFGIAFWSCLASGHPVALLDARLSDDMTDSAVREAGIVLLITDEPTVRNTGYECVTANDILPSWISGEVRSRFARESGNHHNPPASLSERWADHVCLCTSGTTGDARCYVHHGPGFAVQFSCLAELSAKTDRWHREGKNEKILAFIPWHHVFGFIVCFIFPQVLGNVMVIPARPSPEAIIQACRLCQVTQVIAIPAVWNNIARLVRKNFTETSGQSTGEFRQLIELSLAYQKAGVPLPQQASAALKAIRSGLFGESLYLACSGGGYILPETLDILNGIGYYLVNGFGMTETGIVCVENSENIDDRLDGSVGTPFYGHSVSFRPPDRKPDGGHAAAGTESAQGAPKGGHSSLNSGDALSGEIMIRNGALHCGAVHRGRITWRDPEAWFATGDIGRMEKGRLFLNGRVKDIILRADGENLYPDELESAFMGIPGFQRFVIFGWSDGLYDKITLLAEPVPGADPAVLASVVRDINAELPIAQRVERFLISGKPLDLSASAKVRRKPVADAVCSGKWPFKEMALSENAEAPAGETALSDLEKQASVYYTPQIAEDPAFFSVRKTIQSMVADILEIPEDRVTPTSWFAQDLKGDSLQSISLLTRAEEQYELNIDERLFNRDLTVNDIAALVYRRLQGEFASEKSMPPGKDKEETPKTKSSPVVRFEDAGEYRAFKARQAQLEPALKMYGNPYFVAQDSPLRDVSYIGGRKMINFASYNYVGMSGDPGVNEAAIAAIRQYGTSASGSRLLAGEKTIHQQLEQALSRWKGTEDTVVLVGGHSTNVTFVGNFCHEGDLILYDALIHNSVAEGVRLSSADARPFPHNDFKTLEQILKNRRNRYGKVLIAIEGAYSMDGDVAPVPDFVRLKKEYGCFLMVDEAHSMCVLGENGRGVDEYFGIDPGDIDIHMGTLSKGFGACGGYLSGRKEIVEYLRYNLPGFVFSVGISPPLAAAVLKAIEIMERDNSRVKRLRRNIAAFLREARGYGMNTCLAGETAVTPVLIGSDEQAFILSKQLEDDNILVPPAVFPAVARGQARLRFCLTSEHTEKQIAYALACLNRRLGNR